MKSHLVCMVSSIFNMIKFKVYSLILKERNWKKYFNCSISNILHTNWDIKFNFYRSYSQNLSKELIWTISAAVPYQKSRDTRTWHWGIRKYSPYLNNQKIKILIIIMIEMITTKNIDNNDILMLAVIILIIIIIIIILISTIIS